MKGYGIREIKKLHEATGEWHEIPFEELRPLDVFIIHDNDVRVMGKNGDTAWEATSVPFTDVLSGNEPTVLVKGLGAVYLEVGEKVVRR